MIALKCIGTLVLGVVLHTMLIPLGGIATMVVTEKSGSDVAYIVGGWCLPFLVSGVALGKTKGIVAPRVTAPVSALLAILVWFFFVVEKSEETQKFDIYTLCLLPVVGLSYLGALWGTRLAREKANQMIRIPND